MKMKNRKKIQLQILMVNNRYIPDEPSIMSLVNIDGPHRPLGAIHKLCRLKIVELKNFQLGLAHDLFLSARKF